MSEATHRVIYKTDTRQLVEVGDRELLIGESSIVVPTSGLHQNMDDYPLSDFEIYADGVVHPPQPRVDDDDDFEERSNEARSVHRVSNFTLAAIIESGLQSAALATRSGEHEIATQVFDALLKPQWLGLQVSAHIEYMRFIGGGKKSTDENHKRAYLIASIVAEAYFTERTVTDIFGIESTGVAFRAVNPVPHRRQENLAIAVGVVRSKAAEWYMLDDALFVHGGPLVTTIEEALLAADAGLRIGRAAEERAAGE